MMHSKLLMAGAGALRLLERLCRPIHAWFDGCFDRLAMDKRQREQRGFEVDSDDAIVQQEPLRARGLQKAICFVFAIALIWAAFSDVDEVARGDPMDELPDHEHYQIVCDRNGRTVRKRQKLR